MPRAFDYYSHSYKDVSSLDWLNGAEDEYFGYLLGKGNTPRMAKTKDYRFVGKVAWAKLYEPDEFRGSKKWKLPFYPDEETLKAIKDAGIQLRVKEDSGEKSGVSGKFVTFSRGTTANYGKGPEDLAPPVIKDASGKVLVDYDEDFERIGDPVVIGNGSVVEVLVEVYETEKFGNGQRIKEVSIIDLIEYVPEDEDSEAEAPKEQTAKTESKPKRKW